MKGKVKLKIEDTRQFFGDLNQSEPYVFYVAYGQKSKNFKSKKEAKKWLSKFEIEISEIIREIGIHLQNLYQLNIQLTEYISHSQLKHKRHQIDYLLSRYHDLFSFDTGYQIGREIDNSFVIIETQYNDFSKVLRTNNRMQNSYQNIRFYKKQINRLKVDYHTLLNTNDFKNSSTKVIQFVPNHLQVV